MQPSYSNNSETDYDAPNKVLGIYGIQSYMHSKQATSTVTKSSTHSRKSSGGLDETTTTTLLQNLFKPVGGGGAKPVKDLFLPRYSPTDSDDEDKLLDIGDENIDDISEDYSLNEDSILIPEETQHKEEAGKLSLSKGHPLKTMKSSAKSLPVSKQISVSNSVSSSSKDTIKIVTSARKEYATRLFGHGVQKTTADTTILTTSRRSAQSLIQVTY